MGEAAGARGSTAARGAGIGRLRALLATRPSVRAHVFGLILVIVAPLLAFSAALVLRSALNEQEFMANAVRERTREAAAAIDHELGSLRSRLLMLASSPDLLANNFSAFHRQAADMVADSGLSVVLTDQNGQELVNTRARPGDTLPASPDPEALRRVANTGVPDVSSLVRDPSSGEWFIAIDVPVLRDRRAAYVLRLNVAPLLPTMIGELELPRSWLIAISDRDGRTIARNVEADRFVGQMGRPAVLERFRSAREGWFPLVSRDGIPLYNAFAHVMFSGWTVSVGIPDAVLFGPLRGSTWLLILTGAAVLGIALLLARAIGQRIAGAITRLVGYAEAVGRGERINRIGTGIRETDAVAQSLQLAGERLHQSTQERSELLARTITAQEAERRRIARELHDSLGQYLTALQLGFTAIEPHCACNPRAQQRLTRLKSLAGELGRELSRIAWELRPMALDDLGLHRAVTQYLEEWADRSRLQIDVEIRLGDRRLPQPVETALFRVLQEAITNVVKHSSAGRVGVILEAGGSDVRLIVEDDGRGFNLAADEGGLELGVQRLGLVGLRERLALVGGGLELESGPQAGTTVYVRIPL
jgi:signal transduction histidine kinase